MHIYKFVVEGVGVTNLRLVNSLLREGKDPVFCRHIDVYMGSDIRVSKGAGLLECYTCMIQFPTDAPHLNSGARTVLGRDP